MSIVNSNVTPSIARMPAAKLRARYRRITGKKPRPMGLDTLREVVARAETLSRAEDRAKARAPGMHHARDDERLPPPGTVVEREYDGKTHRVTVLDDGFEYAGKRWTSLSTIAKEITGTIWNGYAFFGIRATAKPGLAKARGGVSARRSATG